MIRMSAFVLVVSLVCSAPGIAQTTTGTLLGTVADSSGALLPGATATITSSALPGGPQSTVIDAQGRYRLTGLDPGVYVLTVSLQGFRDYKEELRVTAGGTTERNVSLDLGTVAETVVVTGQGPVVDTRSAAVVTTFNLEVLKSLPIIGGAITEFAATSPGVTQTSPGGYNNYINVMGSTSGETVQVYDGIVSNNPRNGASFQAGDPDNIEEIQVVQVGASAEWGPAAGGVMNVVMKSGTNDFHGDVRATLKPKVFQSQTIKMDCNCPEGKTGYVQTRDYDVSGHIGGPIVRNRAWFYSGLLWREAPPAIVQPGLYSIWVRTYTWYRTPSKLTWQINDSTRLNQTVNLEGWDFFGTGPSTAIAHEAAFISKGHANSYGTELQKAFGDATVLTARVGGYWEPDATLRPRTGDWVSPNREDLLRGTLCCGVKQITKGPYRRDAQSAKLERFVSGRRTTQNLRFGVQIERVQGSSVAAWPSGVQYYDLGGAPSYALFSVPSIQGAGFSTTAVWGEDQVTFADRVTLTLGLRFDRLIGRNTDEKVVDNFLNKTGETIQGFGTMFTWNQWLPRVGLNWKLTGDGRTVVRSTYGIANRPIYLTELDTVHPGIPDITHANYDPGTGGYTNIVSVTNPTRNITFDRDMKPVRTDWTSVGIDRELGRSLAISTSYVYKHTDNLIAWRDIRGVYGQATTTLPDGRPLTVYPLLSPPNDRLFQLTNRPETSVTYQGWLTSLSKRLADRWQAQVHFTLSRNEGLYLTGTAGRDPNDLTNAFGRLSGGLDRPVNVTVTGSYEIPRIDVGVGANFQSTSGVTSGAFASVNLPQGRRNINIEPPGFFRAPRLNILVLRVNRTIQLGGTRRVELIATVQNALQSTASTTSYTTFNYFSPSYAVPTAWVQPRNIHVGARVVF